MQATEEYIHVLTSALSQETGVKIKPGKSWMANVKDKVLIYPQDDLRCLPFYAVRGLLLHELSHILYSTDTPKPLDAIKEYGEKIIFHAFDMLEDQRCESLIMKRYGGFAMKAISDMNYYGVARMIDKCHGDFTQYPKYEQYMRISHLLCLSDRHNEINELVGYRCNHFLEEPNQYNMMDLYWVDPKVRKHFKKTIEQVEKISWKVTNAKTTKEVLDITVNEYLPLLKPLIDKDDKQDQDQKQNQQGKSKSDNQKGQQKQQPPQNSQNDQGGNDGQSGSMPISISDQLKKDLNAEVILGKDGNNGKKTLAGTALAQLKKRQPRLSEAEAAALLRPYITTLATRLRYILQEKAATRFRGLYKQGKLLGKNTYRVLLPNEDRIFSQKSTPDTPKHAVYMAIDCSGSMDGDRETFAFTGGVLLKHVSKELGFTVHMYEFDGGCRELYRLDDYYEKGGGTADEAAFEQIYKDASPSEDNLVFIVTDGETRDNNRGRIMRKLEKERNAQIFGIGIGNGISFETVKQNYPRALKVNEPKELPSALINLMRNIIHR